MHVYTFTYDMYSNSVFIVWKKVPVYDAEKADVLARLCTTMLRKLALVATSYNVRL